MDQSARMEDEEEEKQPASFKSQNAFSSKGMNKDFLSRIDEED
jgi:hypothetical protein